MRIICAATGKRIYFKERLANRAITEAQKRGELPTLRHYPCDDCGFWHLSRKDRAFEDFYCSPCQRYEPCGKDGSGC